MEETRSVTPGGTGDGARVRGQDTWPGHVARIRGQDTWTGRADGMRRRDHTQVSKGTRGRGRASTTRAGGTGALVPGPRRQDV